MTNRRHFIKTSLVGGISFSYLTSLGYDSMNYSYPENAFKDNKNIRYKLTHKIPAKLFDGEKCWVHPRAGIIPAVGSNNMPRVVMTMNLLDLKGSDVFKGMFDLHTDDAGESWTDVRKVKNLAPRFERIEGTKLPIAVSDFWPQYHKFSKMLLGIGHTVVYTPDWKVKNPRPRHTAFSVYNPRKNNWTLWKKMQMPVEDKFYNSGAGCAQRHDKKDGSILLPIYFSPIGKNSHVTVIRCFFDGKVLSYQGQGNELGVDDNTRGLHEPSLTQFDGTYFMTIRNDKKGFVTKSEDGLNFDQIRSWKFDDGKELCNYNTQQHWVTHSDGLFLVYTRKGAANDHVFRHRAPLFMARVDPERLCVIRETEQIIVPERGARLGNFGVTDISPEETWVTVSEWMQPKGVEKYGSDGSIWVARIHWNKPNKNFS